MGLGDHPETFLLKALCCQIAPSWVKVMGWVVAPDILLSSPGTGGILYSQLYSQVPVPVALQFEHLPFDIADHVQVRVLNMEFNCLS